MKLIYNSNTTFYTSDQPMLKGKLTNLTTPVLSVLFNIALAGVAHDVDTIVNSYDSETGNIEFITRSPFPTAGHGSVGVVVLHQSEDNINITDVDRTTGLGTGYDEGAWVLVNIDAPVKSGVAKIDNEFVRFTIEEIEDSLKRLTLTERGLYGTIIANHGQPILSENVPVLVVDAVQTALPKQKIEVKNKFE